MSELYHADETPQRVYWDRRYYMTFDDQLASLRGATTLYVGNLNFQTTELQIHEVFSRVGPVKRIIMGLNRETKMPCGFCFVEYYTYEHACDCLKYISGTACDGNIIRCELDGGFKMGRQFGRGKSGGQIRDEKFNSANPPQSSAFRPPLPSGSPATGTYTSAWNQRDSFGSGRRDTRDSRDIRGSLSGGKRGREIEIDDDYSSRRRYRDNDRRYSGGGDGAGYRRDHSRARPLSPGSPGQGGGAREAEAEEYTDRFGRRRVRGAYERDDRGNRSERIDDRLNSGLSSGRRGDSLRSEGTSSASAVPAGTSEGHSPSASGGKVDNTTSDEMPVKFQRRDRGETESGDQ
jgi:nuclear cap-binding protein subunit 2